MCIRDRIAIQALTQELEKKDLEIQVLTQTLSQEVEQKDQEIKELRDRLNRIEQMLYQKKNRPTLLRS